MVEYNKYKIELEIETPEKINIGQMDLLTDMIEKFLKNIIKSDKAINITAEWK